MPHRPPSSNRGPAAAPDNRRAILAAARRVFAEQGYHVALSTIAKAAGVGQGVLYRHFPSRLDLAFAVFEENWVELEAIAADPADTTFTRLWRRLVELTITEVAFIEMVIDARRTLPDYGGDERLRRVVAGPLERAIAAGRADPALSPEEILLAQRMIYGIVVTSLDQASAAANVRAALSAAPRLPPAP